MQKKIRIENPLPGGHSHTSPNRAKRYEKKGRAAWVQPGVSIRFLSASEIETQSARGGSLSAILSNLRRIDRTIHGYDRSAGTKPLTGREAPHVPLIGPVYKLGLGA